jgi:hypothetical protein
VTEYAPKAIQHLFDTVRASIPSANMGGIIGDSAHDYGYHRGRDYVSGSDYSVQTSPDKKGDGQAACALDISWDRAEDHYAVSQRLLNAKNDARMNAARSFFGSTNGRDVCGWDYYYGGACTSDDSHLWHVHLSILRQYANDDAALQKIAQVIIGSGSSTTTEDDDMPVQKYVYSADGQVTKLSKAGVWYTVGWDADLADTGGVSLMLPDSARYFASTAWVYCAGLPLDANLYWRIQRVHANGGAQEGIFPVGELRGTGGDSDLCLSSVGSLPADTYLRLLASSTVDGTTVSRAWWRVLAW